MTMARRAKAWWVSASTKKQGGGWHWDRFLKRPTSRRQALHWGGPGWIDSTVSFSRIREMRRGDYVIAYQAGEGVVGIAQLKSSGYKSRGSDHFDMFDLRSSPAIRFSEPVSLQAIKCLPVARDTFEFVRAKQGTVFSVEPGGFERILSLGVAFNPEMSTRLLKLAF
jgi:predicted RNA-binding protein with PUA-like domain